MIAWYLWLYRHGITFPHQLAYAGCSYWANVEDALKYQLKVWGYEWLNEYWYI